MGYRTNNDTSVAFSNGIAKKVSTSQSTGRQLFYHGNLIAEWRADGLYISNGGYEGRRGETGSKTTKDRLNAIDGVYITQKNFKWYLNGIEWDGSFVKVDKRTDIPVIDASKDGDVYSFETRYVRAGGWSGYTEYVHAVAGANNTGGWDDSPCPSNVCESELNAIKTELKKHGITVKEKVAETTNVFCVHVYLIPKIKFVQKAREIVKEFLGNNTTRLAYIVE